MSYRGKIISGGRISIPSKVRKKMELKEGTFYELRIQAEDTLVIKFFKV